VRRFLSFLLFFFSFFEDYQPNPTAMSDITALSLAYSTFRTAALLFIEVNDSSSSITELVSALETLKLYQTPQLYCERPRPNIPVDEGDIFEDHVNSDDSDHDEDHSESNELSTPKKKVLSPSNEKSSRRQTLSPKVLRGALAKPVNADLDAIYVKDKEKEVRVGSILRQQGAEPILEDTNKNPATLNSMLKNAGYAEVSTSEARYKRVVFKSSTNNNKQKNLGQIRDEAFPSD
jgi:hypothetical protein